MTTQKTSSKRRTWFYATAGVIVLLFILSIILTPGYYFPSNEPAFASRIQHKEVKRPPQPPATHKIPANAPSHSSANENPPIENPSRLTGLRDRLEENAKKGTPHQILRERLKKGEDVTLPITITDEDGKPIPDASVCRMHHDDTLDDITRISDNGGKCVIHVKPDDQMHLQLLIRAKGFVPCRVAVLGDIRIGKETKFLSILPNEITVPLTRGKTIGGTVQLENSSPMPNIELRLSLPQTRWIHAEKRMEESWPHCKVVVQTDENGQWTYDSAIDNSKRDFFINVNNKDYDELSELPPMQGRLQALAEKKHILTIRKKIRLEGRALDEKGTPIKGARVALNDNISQSLKTDANGYFKFDDIRNRRSPHISIIAKGLAPYVSEIKISKDMKPLDCHLTKGRKVVFHVTDMNGKPINGAQLAITHVKFEAKKDPKRVSRLYANFSDLENNPFTKGEDFDKVSTKTDANGYACFENAPDARFEFEITCPGYNSRENDIAPYKDVDPRNPDLFYMIGLQKPFRIHGQITDADTATPLPQANISLLIEHKGSDRPAKMETDIPVDSQGHYKLEINYNHVTLLLLTQADGYTPILKRFENSDVDITFNPRLKQTPAKIIQVFSHTGKPAVNAKGIIAGDLCCAAILPSSNDGFSENNTHKFLPAITADKEGFIMIPPQIKPFEVAVIHDDGFAITDNKTLSEKPTIQLQPWSKIEGSIETSPSANNLPAICVMESKLLEGNYKRRSRVSQKPNENGHFTIDKLFPGKTFVGYYPGKKDTKGTVLIGKFIDLAPGKTTQINFGEKDKTSDIEEYRSTSCYVQPILLSRLSIGLTAPKIANQLKTSPEFKTALISGARNAVHIIGTPEQAELFTEIIDKLKSEAAKEEHQAPPEGYPTLSIQKLEGTPPE